MNANEYYCRKLTEKDKQIMSLTNEIRKLKISDSEKQKYLQKLELQKLNYDSEKQKYFQKLQLQKSNYDNHLQQQYLRFVKELTEIRRQLYYSLELNKKLEEKNSINELLIEKLQNIPLATEIDIKVAEIKPPEPLLPPPN